MEVTSLRAGIARLDANWREDPHTGGLHVKMFVSKPGVLVYESQRADGTAERFRELVTAEVLHDAAIRATLENKIIMNEHRYDESGKGILVSGDNAKQFLDGWTAGKHEIAEDGEHTTIDGVIIDPGLKNLIKSGKHQLSPGYKVKLDATPGVDPVYGEYDAKQVWREYNHVAVTWRGRTGPTVAIRTDSDTEQIHKFDAWEIPADNANLQEDREMGDQNTGVKLDALQEQIKLDAQKIGGLELQVKNLGAEKEQLQGRVDALEAELAEAKRFDKAAAVRETLALIEKARPHLPETTKFDGMADLDIKKAVISAKYDGLSLDGMTAERIDGMFDIAVQQPKPSDRTDSMKRARASYDGAETVRVDGESDIDASRQRMIDKLTAGRE